MNSTSRAKAFLNKQVGFSGNNLHVELRKHCLLVRAVLEKPELLLVYEEALDFGSGLEYNLQLLFELLEETTVVAITQSNQLLDRYQKIMLMDAGYVLSGGSLEEQLKTEDSYLCKYLLEADPRTLEVLLSKYGLDQVHKNRRLMKRENRFTLFQPGDFPLIKDTQVKLPLAEPSTLEHGESDKLKKRIIEPNTGGRRNMVVGPSKSAADWKEGWLKSGIFTASIHERSKSVAQFPVNPHFNETPDVNQEIPAAKVLQALNSDLENVLNLSDGANIDSKLPGKYLEKSEQQRPLSSDSKHRINPSRLLLPALEVFGTSTPTSNELIKKQLTRKAQSQAVCNSLVPVSAKNAKRHYHEGVYPVRVFLSNPNDLSAKVSVSICGPTQGPNQENAQQKRQKKTRTVTVEEQVCVLTRRTVVITEEYTKS